MLDKETLDARASQLDARTSPCRLCPHECGVYRKKGERGRCRLAEETLVASAAPHFGEEPPISGTRGSGTIFFSSCNLSCVFCQNAEISHSARGSALPPRDLAALMLHLQHLGCHNINLVSPTHVTHTIVRAFAFAAEAGLRIPLVYNCGGYESVETLGLLDGIVDIYMPDIKYSSDEEGLRYSGAKGYWQRAKEAVREMQRQVGELRSSSLDIRMPEIDGLHATRGIKSRWPEIKVLVLSLYEGRQEEARAAGADLFVSKGESPERLLCALSSLL